MSPRTRPDAAERQFSLVLALMRTELGLTRADIFSSVHGYRQAFEADGASPALQRLFERDKQDLRDLGIPIDTLDDPSAPGDNQLIRYRIREDAARMPAGIRLDAEETALVSIAAAVWREGSLAGESRTAAMKLRARGADLSAAAARVAPRLRMREAAFEPLADAIRDAVVVSFDYRKPTSTAPERRRVEPLALVRYGGRWLLAGFDLDRGAERRYLLERITGAPRRHGPVDAERAAGRAGRRIADETLASLRDHAAANPVAIEVDRGSDAEHRLRRLATSERDLDASTVRFELASADHDLLADDLAAFGPELVVRTPDTLRVAVAERLEAALSAHLDAPRGRAGGAGR